MGKIAGPRRIFLWGLVVLVVASSGALLPHAARAESRLYPSHQQRFGVGATDRWGRDILDYTLSWTNPGWYMNWAWAANPARPGGIDYAQLIGVGATAWPPNWTALRQAILANPGALWILGNEPDTRSQDECAPFEYAIRHHDLYQFIKGVDPTARIANGSIVQPTPLRLRWLNEVLAAYRALYGVMMPVDVWNIHVQILQESRGGWGCGIPIGINDVDEGTHYTVTDNADPAIFIEHIWRFRQWMYDHGQADKPLIITEYGVVMPPEYLPLGNASVQNFMRETFRFSLRTTDSRLGCPTDGYRLVQRWAWYSLNEKPYDVSTGEGYNGGLYRWDRDELTDFGRLYAEFTADAAPQTLLLVPDALQAVPDVTYLFTATYRDPNGYADLSEVHLLLNQEAVEPGGVYLRYVPATGRLYLRQVDDSAWLPAEGYFIGTANQASNALATLRVDQCYAAHSGDTLSVTLALRFGAAMQDQRWRVYLRAEDRYGVLDGWNQAGLVELGAPPVESATIQGRFTLQARPAAPHPSWLTSLNVKLYQGGAPKYDLNLVSDDTGRFAVPDILPGTYDVRVKGARTLSNRRNGVELREGDNALDLGVLREGDANGDDWVDVVDFSILRSTFGSADPRADFSNDGWIDIVDF